MKDTNFKNIQKRMKERKKQQKQKKWQKKGKVGNKPVQMQESSSDEEQSDEEVPDAGQESDGEAPGHFYLKFKEAVPPLVKKDMMIEDLWILMKRPIITN